MDADATLKDETWDEFEDLSCEVMCSHGSPRHGFILHCFATYLDALINQGTRGNARGR